MIKHRRGNFEMLIYWTKLRTSLLYKKVFVITIIIKVIINSLKYSNLVKRNRNITQLMKGDFKLHFKTTSYTIRKIKCLKQLYCF